MTINKYLRNILLVGLFVVPFIPMFVSEALFFPFITGKNFEFRIIVEIIFALWAILAIRDPKYRPAKSPILWAVAAFIGFITLADILGANPYRSFWSNYERMEGLITYLHLFAYFIVAGAVLSKEQMWKFFFHTSIGVSLFTCVFGLLQRSGALTINQGGERVDATFGNAIYLAVYLMFHIFLALMYAFRAKDEEDVRYPFGALMLGSLLGGYYIIEFLARGLSIGGSLGLLVVSVIVNLALYFFVSNRRTVSRIFYAEIIVLQMIVLYYTATRGATLGLIGGLILASILAAYKLGGRAKKVASAVLVAFVLLVVAFFGAKNTDFVKKNPVLGRFASISLNDTTIQSRWIIWGNISIAGFKDHPMLGWGEENFNLVFNKYYDHRLWIQEPWFDRSHNIFFDWLISGGLLGLLAYISMFAAALYAIFKKEGNALSVVDKSILFGLIAGYVFQNLTVFDNLTSGIMFFSVLAFLETTQYGIAANMAAGKLPENGKAGYGQAASAVIVIAAVIFLYYANVKPILASKSLIKAINPSVGPVDQLKYFKQTLAYNTFGSGETREQLVQFAVNTARNTSVDASVRNEALVLARDEIIKQVDQSPTDARYRFFAGSFYNKIGMSDDAIAQLKLATQYSNNKQFIMFELGAAYINKKMYKEAEEVFKQAYESDPSYDEARKFYALGVAYTGDDKLADSILNADGRTKIPVDERFSAAYIARGDYKKAIEFWRSRVQADPTNYSNHVSLASIYLNMGERNKAIAELTEAIKANPSFKDQGEFYIKEIRAGRNP